MDDGICSLPAMIGTRMLAAGVDGSRWVSRSSKPLRGGLRCPGRVRLPRTPAMRCSRRFARALCGRALRRVVLYPLANSLCPLLLDPVPRTSSALIRRATNRRSCEHVPQPRSDALVAARDRSVARVTSARRATCVHWRASGGSRCAAAFHAHAFALVSPLSKRTAD